jgi:small-conductance mechanosensitive channel
MSSGILLLCIGCFFLEQSTVIKKRHGSEINIHQISFLTLLAVMIFSGIAVRFSGDRTFTWTLTSFFLLVFQIFAGVLFNEFCNKAIHHADRSTFSVMSTMTIPLLLVFDLLLGYTVTWWQICGVILLTFMLGYAFFRGRFSMKGMKYIITANIISLATVIAFKYATTHYASTELMNFYNAGGMSILFFIIICKTTGFKGIKQVFKAKYL